MLHGTVQIAGVGNLAVSPNILWSWAIACCAGTLLAASPALMGSSAPPGTGSSLPGTAVIFVDDDNCPGPGSGTEGDPYCSIQTAIDNAVDLDEIIVAPGTYFETINFLGKAIWLHSSDGPDVTTIDAQQKGVVVLCVNGEGPDTALDGFAITGGSGASGGGMINSFFSSPTVTNCTFSDNSANFGGGMTNSIFSSPTVTNCTFTANTALNVGGGMWNVLGSSPTVTNCTFSGNSAQDGGGGMNNESSSPTVTNCTFTGNTAHRGGGMDNFVSSTTVTNCTFSGNSASLTGGAMTNFGADPLLVNCTFSGNVSKAEGGAMWSFSSTLTVVNCTFSGNAAGTSGGGMYNLAGSQMVTNSIFWENGPDQIFGDLFPVTTVSFSTVQGGWPGSGNIDADPLFVDPDNGDFRLSSGSPCIDAGDNTAVPAEITTDLDGNPRFVDDPDTPDTGNGEPPIVDMGAYEFQLPCPWDLNGDHVVSVPDLLLLLGDFRSCDGSLADFDGDGCVGVPDLLALIANFGPCPGSECVWDINGDGFVDNDDLQQVVANQGPCDGCPEDVNGDGIVNGQDAAAVATHFGPCP